MPSLFLRGQPIGTIQGVLFDKDGTLSNSERHLFNIAKLRVQEACRIHINSGASTEAVQKLKDLLSIAYGLTNEGINPHGTIAIGSRENNKISTATIFCLLGESWSKANLSSYPEWFWSGSGPHIGGGARELSAGQR